MQSSKSTSQAVSSGGDRSRQNDARPIKVAIVTGSSRGIGRAIAMRLAADGARVVVNYRHDTEAAEGVVNAIMTSGGEATAVQADVADPTQVLSLFDAAEQHYGGLDIFVHNAYAAVHGPLAEATDDNYEHIFSVNARATFVALREAASRLHDGGRVVFISSGITRASHPFYGLYAASKAAGEQLVRAFSRELAPRGITANSVLPGMTDTDSFRASSIPVAEAVGRIPLGRLGRPEDVADVVGFLASDAGRWITGQSIAADGGLT